MRGVLRRLKITHKRGRDYVHSPDPEYDEKVRYIEKIIENHDSSKQVILFMDELTLKSHPSVGYDYARTNEQPRARRGIGAEKQVRLCGVINAVSGRTDVMMRKVVSVHSIISFYQSLSKIYPTKQILVIQDNWPVHCHPDIIAALEKQESPFKHFLPASWKEVKPKKKYSALNIPVQMLFLPSYASWLNPIEKVWKKLKQEKVHQHTHRHDFTELKQAAEKWFQPLLNGSEELLKYVGLKKEGSFYAKAFNNNLQQFQRTVI